MRDGSFLKGVINNCYKNNGKMYFIVTKEIMHHALVNLPFNGVYLGV
jgi:hypothetical protein